VIILPAMSVKQAASWHALMDLYQRLPEHWVLIGGQMVHLHCAEHEHFPERPTDDADTVVDVRADPNVLLAFTGALADMGFKPDTSGDGIQHRWTKGDAQIDVLLPEGIGEAAAARHGVGGAPTIQAKGGSQALARAETVDVEIEGRRGHVRRPNLIGALIMKAAAHEAIGDSAKGRHRRDFATLAALIAARDLRDAALRPKDRQRLRSIIAAIRIDEEVMFGMDGAAAALDRVERGAGLD
jgi:hypothetical protein